MKSNKCTFASSASYAKLVADAAKYEAEITKYTKDTAAAFTAALEGAKDELQTHQIHCHYQKHCLQLLHSLLSLLFPMLQLPHRLSIAQGKVESAYTKESWAPFKAALTAAEGVLVYA